LGAQYNIVPRRFTWAPTALVQHPEDFPIMSAAVQLDVDRQKVRDSPEYDKSITVDGLYDERFLTYYGIKWIAPWQAIPALRSTPG
jgi:hypothetical protein